MFDCPRPGFIVYQRAKHESAVEVAASLQRLRLRDRRTGLVHDYTQPDPDKQLVCAFTTAASNSPAWVADPEELWNRAELSEFGKGAQVARHLSVPLPPALDQEQAMSFSMQLAQYVCEKLETPVAASLYKGMKVDPNVDGGTFLQELFHVQLLVPMRRLVGVKQSGVDAAMEAVFGEILPAQLNRHVRINVETFVKEAWSSAKYGWHHPAVLLKLAELVQARRQVGHA